MRTGDLALAASLAAASVSLSSSSCIVSKVAVEVALVAAVAISVAEFVDVESTAALDLSVDAVLSRIAFSSL